MTHRIISIVDSHGGVLVTLRRSMGRAGEDLIVDPLTPAQARGWAAHLLAAAERYEAQEMKRLRALRNHHAAELEKVSRQIVEIEAALIGSEWQPISADDLREVRA